MSTASSHLINVGRQMDSMAEIPVVRSCYISQAVNSEDGKDVEREQHVMMDMRPVQLRGNAILAAILRARSWWHKSPIVWVGNAPYKIKILQDNHMFTMLLQMSVRYNTRGTRQNYKIVNKRMVMIYY